MKQGKPNQIVVYVIHASTLKKLLLLDVIVGSGIYYVVKIISASVIAATVGSILGTEGIKRGEKIMRKRP